MATYFFRNAGASWGTAANWSLTDGGGATGAVPTAADTANFTVNSGNCTVDTSSRVCLNLNFTGYTNTITMTNSITVSGNLTLSATMTIAGTSGLTLNSVTPTITSNTKTWPNNLTFNALNQVVTLADNWTVGGNWLCNQSTSTFNGNIMNVAGNFTTTGAMNNGTTKFVLNGTGTWSGAQALRNDIEINTAGTITLSGTVLFATKTLTLTLGTLSVGTSILSLSGSCTVTINNTGFTMNALSFTGSATFGGTNGWTTAAFSCTTAGTTITLASTITYTITTTMTVTGTIASPVLIKSSVGGSRAILTLNNTASATADCFCNATDIDSSLGQTIISFAATLSNTLNWNVLTAPKTISYGIIS